jgi:hypothetical protein
MSRGSERDMLYDVEHAEASPMTGPMTSPMTGRSQSDPVLPRRDSLILTISKLWKTDANLNQKSDRLAAVDSGKEKKRVKWNRGVSVVLIPTREEYANANLFDKIWWRDEAYEEFKKSAMLDIAHAMRRHNVSQKTAIVLLYSNFDLEDDEERFYFDCSTDNLEFDQKCRHQDCILADTSSTDLRACLKDNISPYNTYYVRNVYPRSSLDMSSFESLHNSSEESEQRCGSLGQVRSPEGFCGCHGCIGLSAGGCLNQVLTQATQSMVQQDPENRLCFSTDGVLPAPFDLAHVSAHSGLTIS